MATRQPSTFVSMADSLAAQHRPILRFDDVEKWRPLNVDSFLSGAVADRRALSRDLQSIWMWATQRHRRSPVMACGHRSQQSANVDSHDLASLAREDP